MKKIAYDIGVIVPLEEELEQFLEVFPMKTDLSTDTLQIHEVKTDETPMAQPVFM